MTKIAITDTGKATLQAYIDWVRKITVDGEIVILSHSRRNLSDLDGCDGLVLTGGSDIHPGFYGRNDFLPMVIGPDTSRDEFEISIIRKALDNNLPVLGICRGMQMFNVALGGTLIPDVQSAGFLNHGKNKDSNVDGRHGVLIEPDSIIESIARTSSGDVNSSHHQAVDKPGRGLRATVRSVDGLIEGMEWDQREGRPFLQLVQWHPERMEDFENPLSRGLLERFAGAVQVSND